MKDILTQKLCAPPKLEGIKRALFIEPHPDDNEIGAGGAMAWLRDRGVEVWALTVLDDSRVCPEADRKDGLTIRQREALAARQALDIKHAGFLGFADKTEESAETIAAAIIPVIRRLRPDAVFSVDPTLENECHRDHIKVGWAVRYAVMDAAWEHCQPQDKPWETPILGQYFTGKPNTLVDISAYIDKKWTAVKAHRSQVSKPLLFALERQAAYFGAEKGCKYAEALKLYTFTQLHCFNLPIR